MRVDSSPFELLRDKQVRLDDFAGRLARCEIGPISGATLELMNGLTTDPKVIILKRPKLPGLKSATVMGRLLRIPQRNVPARSWKLPRRPDGLSSASERSASPPRTTSRPTFSSAR